uniref:Uncharacterized protein n=1 Tax=Lotharella globosa TaxID=91324 RepID=A0A7S4E1B8_9EUKA
MRGGMTMTMLAFGASLVLFASPIAAQDDGNPHHWDRQRRCDQDYEPPCGPCEGVGGIPHGDRNDQITLASCDVVALPGELKAEDRPKAVWGEAFSFSGRGYHEVLIGPRRDPFCFEVFPNANSHGPLCYRKEEGSIQYDMAPGGTRAMQLDLHVQPKGHPLVPNITGTVLHAEQNMWIANNLWLGVDLCLCFIAVPDVQKNVTIRPHIYPVQYNWVDAGEFLGRVRVGVEYLWRDMVLDHYVIGPHHFFVDVSEARPGVPNIRRMWQPFNGLEVLDPALLGPLNRSKIAIPPPMCTKKAGGALKGIFRINCDDEGYPLPCSNATYHNKYCKDTNGTGGGGGATEGAGPSHADRARARQVVPGPDFRGDHAAHSWGVLNKHLARQFGSRLKACELWRVHELQELQMDVLMHADHWFNDLYENRSDHRRLSHLDTPSMLREWVTLNHLASQSPRISPMHRDGHCAEAVMWIVHHLTDAAREALLGRAELMIPSLSETHHECPGDATTEEKAVCAGYHNKVTCATCHSKATPPS